MGLAGSPKYTILGTVTLEKDWLGVLGYSTQSIGPFPGGDHYFWQAGGVTYVDLLAKARETYPDADAVVDINYDYSGSVYWVFYAKRTNIVSGIAIKYSREEVDYPPAK
jgi:hypothetical protein